MTKLGRPGRIQFPRQRPFINNFKLPLIDGDGALTSLCYRVGLTAATAGSCAQLVCQLRSLPADRLRSRAMRTNFWKRTLKNTVQRLGEPGDRALDVMQFVQAE